jgi:hypothetical protein
MRQLQPAAIRILDPDIQHMVDAHAAAPGALLLPRFWSMSEQKQDMIRDPISTGKRHAREWREKVNAWRATGAALPADDRIIVVGINEPPVWEALQQTVDYTVAFLRQCQQLGLRACALNLSVGWPANTGEGTPPDWTPYASVLPAIKDGRHYLCTHSYWYHTGPQDGWGWWAGRILKCPWDVPVIIGETGVDCFVDAERWKNEGGNRGWQGHMSPEQYAGQIVEYVKRLDSRIVAVTPFLTDYRSREWASFDTEPAHAAIVAVASTAKPSGSGSTIYLPTVPGGGGDSPSTAPPPPTIQPAQGRGKVTAHTLNVRSGPGTEYPVVGQLVYGQTVDYDAVAGDWLRLSEGRWIHGGYVGAETPTPPSDCWSRAIAFTLNLEGGLSTDPHDPGNYRPDGTFVGTKYGISANSYPDLDIPNLTKEQAIEIYKRDYWLPSGAAAVGNCRLAMAIFDHAVNAGVGSAKTLLAQSGMDFNRFMAERLRFYTHLDSFDRYGRAWTRRVADLLDEAA